MALLLITIYGPVVLPLMELQGLIKNLELLIRFSSTGFSISWMIYMHSQIGHGEIHTHIEYKV